MILTTAMSVEGRTVSEYLGIATSQAIMGVSVGRDIKALGRSISGGRSGAYEEEVAKAVQEALRELGENAAALGADALVAVDLDYAEVGNNMLMVAASGTAVKLA
jgi:uncharacterized protein YbjQ (UPF0145 family)